MCKVREQWLVFLVQKGIPLEPVIGYIITTTDTANQTSPIWRTPQGP